MAEVAALIEPHAHQLVALLEESQAHGQVGGSPRAMGGMPNAAAGGGARVGGGPPAGAGPAAAPHGGGGAGSAGGPPGRGHGREH